MLTPQDIQKVTFDRSFTGYDTRQVDAFLEPLSEDYIALYQENVVLKSKLKVAVERISEFQLRESNIDAANIRAQKQAERLLAETQAKCDRMLRQAEEQARARLGQLMDELNTERERVNTARRASSEFIALLEKTVAQQLTTLDLLRSVSDLPPSNLRQAYDYELDSRTPAQAPPPMTPRDAQRITRDAARLLDQLDAEGESRHLSHGG